MTTTHKFKWTLRRRMTRATAAVALTGVLGIGALAAGFSTSPGRSVLAGFSTSPGSRVLAGVGTSPGSRVLAGVGTSPGSRALAGVGTSPGRTVPAEGHL